jgi:hypothetical protein
MKTNRRKRSRHELRRGFEGINVIAARAVLEDPGRWGDGLRQWAELVLSKHERQESLFGGERK